MEILINQPYDNLKEVSNFGWRLKSGKFIKELSYSSFYKIKKFDLTS